MKRLSGLRLPRFEIRVCLLLCTVCPWYLLYPVLPCTIRELGEAWVPHQMESATRGRGSPLQLAR